MAEVELLLGIAVVVIHHHGVLLLGVCAIVVDQVDWVMMPNHLLSLERSHSVWTLFLVALGDQVHLTVWVREYLVLKQRLLTVLVRDTRQELAGTGILVEDVHVG